VICIDGEHGIELRLHCIVTRTTLMQADLPAAPRDSRNLSMANDLRQASCVKNGLHARKVHATQVQTAMRLCLARNLREAFIGRQKYLQQLRTNDPLAPNGA
jgi:hypothetical protein